MSALIASLEASPLLAALFYLAIVAALAVWFGRASGALRYIPNDRLGILEKLWSFRGSVRNGLIALKGEAGFQPEVLRGGFHFFMPFQYRNHAGWSIRWPFGGVMFLTPLPAFTDCLAYLPTLPFGSGTTSST